MSADKLFLGNIVTMEPGKPVQEAMTVKDGMVQFVGTRAVAQDLCDEDTQVVDFGQNYIYPGTLEGHCHPDLAGIRLALQADLTAGTSMAEFVDMMKAFIDERPGADEYRGAGWVELDCKPTAAMLDAICPDIPVALNSIDGHSMWLNTAAMERYGINQAAVEEWGTDCIRVDEQGNPTGYISEGPAFKITGTMSYTAEQKEAAFLAWQDFAFSQGLTAVMHAGVMEEACQIYQSLIDKGLWKLRTYGVFLLDEHEPDYVAKVKYIKELAEKYNSEYFQIIGVKVFMDGVVEGHTAWMLDPYNDDPTATGVKRMSDFERFTDALVAATEEGLLIHCHTIGDGAVKFAIDCMEAAQKRAGDFTARHAMCHLQCMRPEDVQRMADLRITPVVAPLWATKDPTYLDMFKVYIGDERIEPMYPIKAFLDAGAHVAFHTDFPVSTLMGVPRTVYIAETRRGPEMAPENALNPEGESISRMDALAGLTTGTAYSVKQEDHLGQLTPGFVANMVVFDQDFLTADIEDVPQAKLLATIIDGETVYSA